MKHSIRRYRLILGGILAWTLLLATTDPAAASVSARLGLTFDRLIIEPTEDGQIALDKDKRLRVLAEGADGRKFAYDGRVRWSSSNGLVSIGNNGFARGTQEGRT
ncbi:MAG: hypothetical protein ACOVS5_05150, partial [Oligoflexus sp.]